MKLSCALCTYEGAAYLGAQLESIAAQVRRPDELVVFDDASSDDTVALACAFAARAPFEVRVAVNPARLGSTRNFERAIAACTGDVVVLADQDDVWRSDKLAALEARFAARPGVGVVFSDARLVDDRLRPLGRTAWEVVGFGPAERRRIATPDAFWLLFERRIVTGATMAFRSRFRDLVLPFPEVVRDPDDPWLIHDGWIALAVSAVADVDFVDEPLVDYRQHGAQQLGMAPSTRAARRAGARGRGLARIPAGVLEARAQAMEKTSTALERLVGASDRIDAEATRRRLVEGPQHFRAREALPRRRLRRVLPVLREARAGRYRRYSNGVLSVLKDLAS